MRTAGAAAAALEQKIGVALASLGRFKSGISRLRRARDLYWEAGDYAGFRRNTSALTGLLYNSGDTAGAIDIYRRALASLEEKLPRAELDKLRAHAAYECVAALDFDFALSLVEGIEPQAESETAAFAHMASFKIAAMRGDVPGWRHHAESALASAAALPPDDRIDYIVHCQIALDAVGLGEVRAAREQFDAALSHAIVPQDEFRYLARAASAFEHTLRGDFSAAAELLEAVDAAGMENYAVLVHRKLAQYALGICSGDDARLRREDTESFLRYGLERGMKLAIGLVGGPYAWALGVNGATDEAAAWIRRIARVLPGPHRFAFAFLAAAQFGAHADVVAMRRLLADGASRPHDRVNAAVLGLFDAFAGRRGAIACDVRERALAAAAGFEAIGWPWLEARAYELAGELKCALDAYRALGAVRDVRRMEQGAVDGAGVLSPREREVGRLVASGCTNDEIGRILLISARTVEKHVSAALSKLKLRSRMQLGRLLAERDGRSGGAGEPGRA